MQQKPITLIGNPYMFTARRYDLETGLYYYRARYYNPYIGRFLQKDPAGQGMNMYAYCGNNSLNCNDPSGLITSLQPGALLEIAAYYGPEALFEQAVALYGRPAVIQWIVSQTGQSVAISGLVLAMLNGLSDPCTGSIDPCSLLGVDPCSPLSLILDGFSKKDFKRWMNHKFPVHGKQYNAMEILHIYERYMEVYRTDNGRAHPPHGIWGYHFKPDENRNIHIPITKQAYDILIKMGF